MPEPSPTEAEPGSAPPPLARENDAASISNVATAEGSVKSAPGGSRALPDPPSVDAPGGRAYRKAPVRTVDLPESFVEGAGGALTRQGTPRLDVLAAARASYVQRKSDRADSEAVQFDSGAYAFREEGEHVKSIQGHAEDVWRRIYKRPVPKGDPLDDADFRRLYDRTRKALQRSDLLDDRGPAVPAPSKKVQDRHGKRWSLSDELGEAERGRESADPRPFIRCTTGALDGDDAGVWTRCERRVAREEKMHRAFTHALTASDLPGPWRTADGRRFERRHARDGGDRPRYVTVGRWRPEAVGREDRRRQAVRVPWIVAEIDGRDERGEKDRAVSDRLARRLLRRLDAFGMDLSGVMVSYSGNASIHVRIPDGAVGCPIYRTADEAARSIGRFFDRLCGRDDALREAIDDACFRPGQMIRAVGSTHEATGRQTVATGGRTFLQKPSCYLWSLSEPQFEYSPPERLPLPRRAVVVPGLSSLLEPPKPTHSEGGAEMNVQQCLSGGQGVASDGARSAVARVRGGVVEGERWGRDVDRPAAVGRNWAALYVSHRALTREPTVTAAWGAVVLWNGRNEPPLPRRELRAVFERAAAFQRGHVWT